MKNNKLKYSLVALAIVSSLPATAAGFKLYEQSTSAMGNAYAGRGAQITDASVGYTNPAAFIQLDKAQYSIGLNMVAVNANYRNASATSANGQAVSGSTSGDLDGISAIPHFHYYQPINQRLGFGFSIAVPFGTSSDYDNDFIGRYFAQQTELQVIAFQPALSYQVNDNFSIGGAIALNYAQGTLSKYKDHGGLCELGTAINATYAALSQNNFTDVAQTAYCDSVYQVEGDDIQPSYTLGLHYRLNDQINLALSYHSAVKYNLEGDSTIYNTPVTGEFAKYTANPSQYWTAPTIPALGVNGAAMPVVDLTTGKLAVAAPKTEASSLVLDTPQSVIFSVDGQLTSALSLQFSATWTQWSKFTDITVLSESAVPSISASTQQAQTLNSDGYIGYIPEQWQDTWAYALGANYVYSDNLTLKAGIARDNSPVNDNYRSARIPADSRSWFTIGAHYQPQQPWSIDVAAGMMLMDDSSVTDHEYNAQTNRIYNSSYQADYEINAYVVSLQFNYYL